LPKILRMTSGFEDVNEHEPSEGELLDEGTISAEEEGFMRGYSEDEEVPTCDECGIAMRENKITKLIDGETRCFCSKDCAQDFEDSMG
jgi:hypothetical protein